MIDLECKEFQSKVEGFTGKVRLDSLEYCLQQSIALINTKLQEKIAYGTRWLIRTPRYVKTLDILD